MCAAPGCTSASRSSAIADAKTPDRADARALVNAMRERHVLISVCGHDGNVLKIRPPLVFSMADVDWFCSEFTDSARPFSEAPAWARTSHMSVTAFQDLPLADRDREWDGDAAEKRVRKWAGAEDEPNQKYRDAHVWYDGDKKDNFTAYKLLIADVVGGKLEAVPRGVMAAGAIMEGARGGIDLPEGRHRPGEEPPRQVLQEDGRRRLPGSAMIR